MAERYSAFAVGDSAEERVTITEAHFAGALELFGDRHPIHHDDAYAIARGHPGRTLPGSVIAGVGTSALATILSECGLALLRYDLRYKAPVYLGDQLTARCVVTRTEDKPHRNGGLVFLDVGVRNQDGLVAEGEAVDLATDEPAA